MKYERAFNLIKEKYLTGDWENNQLEPYTTYELYEWIKHKATLLNYTKRKEDIIDVLAYHVKKLDKGEHTGALHITEWELKAFYETLSTIELNIQFENGEYEEYPF